LEAGLRHVARHVSTLWDRLVALTSSRFTALKKRGGSNVRVVSLPLGIRVRPRASRPRSPASAPEQDVGILVKCNRSSRYVCVSNALNAAHLGVKIVQCFDCIAKPTPRSFPVCPICSTPSQPIHCIVWAMSYRYLSSVRPCLHKFLHLLICGYCLDGTSNRLSVEEKVDPRVNKV
jgi:hypothetical protein